MLAEHRRTQTAATALRQAARRPEAESAELGTPAARPLEERDFYPEHDRRRDRPQYAQVHQRLCITLDLPCLVCGVRSSTLSDPAENRYGARQLETHHHVIEWALAGAVDVARFNKTIRPHLLARQPEHPIYQRAMSAAEVRDWVDHSEDNLWVLCDIHHRHRELGIHDTPYPLWCPQDLLRPDFAAYVEQQSQVPLAPIVPPPSLPPADKPAAGRRTTANRITAKLKIAPQRPR